MSDSLTPPPSSGPELTPPPGSGASGPTSPPAEAAFSLTPPPGAPNPANLKTFTFRMTLPENWARVDHASLGDPAAVEAQLQKYVELERLSGAQADALATVFAGLAPQLQGRQIPLVAAYAEPAGDGRFGLASMFAGPHVGEFPLGETAEAITVNDAPGKLQRGTLKLPFGKEQDVPVYAAQYVLESPVPPGFLVITAVTPLVQGFDQAAADARFHEAVREIVFHPAD